MTLMAGPSADDFKERVRTSTDIVHLIGERHSLVSNGRGFKCLCPFHDDKNPSLTVNPERQTYRCWACGAAGDCFSYVMKEDLISFPEALEFLAKRAGLEMPQRMQRSAGNANEKSSLCDVLEWAEKEFHQCLLSTAVAERARNYLAKRGFSQKSIAQFKLGYHPDSWDWLIQRARGQFDPELLVRADLAKAREGGNGYHDKFLDRVMFPIHNERGRTVAFGGRILPDAADKPDARYLNPDAKYLNSSETPVFSKSRICYALDIAREAIKKTNTVLVMEGYADCVKAHQGGILNAVATLGTALTETHVTNLKRLAQKVILVFDGDKAGKDAAEKSIPRFLGQQVDLRILTVPDGLDPDEYIEEHGGDALLKLAEQAPEAFDYQLQLLTSRFGTTTLDARQRVLDGVLNLLTISPGVAGTVKEDLILGKLRRLAGISEADIRRRLTQLRTEKPAPTRKVAPDISSDDSELRQLQQTVDSLQRNANNDEKLECELLQLLFHHPDMTHAVRREIGPDDFYHEVLREILSLWFDMQDAGGDPAFGRFLSRIECVELKRLIVWIEESSPLRGDRKSLKPAHGMGMETADQGLNRVIERLKWRRTSAKNEASKSLLFERPSETSKLTEDFRAVLEQASQFHRERTAK